jgi:carnitine O-acetyltransferase
MPQAGGSASALSATDAGRIHGLLKAAAGAHVAYSREAAAARDVDRHLLALKLLWQERKAAAAASAASADQDKGRLAPGPDPAADFFSDPVYDRTRNWLISTSNLTHEAIDNWGWGEVTPGGLGVAYSTRKDSLRFNVVAEAGTGADAYAACLRGALRDMRALALAAKPAADKAGAAAGRAKL